jgi:hypothetical protein
MELLRSTGPQHRNGALSLIYASEIYAPDQLMTEPFQEASCQSYRTPFAPPQSTFAMGNRFVFHFEQNYGESQESLHEKPNFSLLRFGLDGRVQRAPVKADEEQVSACRYVDITNPNHDGN